MISTKKLLKYINRHPKCNSIQLANKFFKGDERTLKIELKKINQYFHCEPVKDQNGIQHLYDFGLTFEGKQYLNDSFSEWFRFWFPVVISILALVISIVAIVLESQNQR